MIISTFIMKPDLVERNKTFRLIELPACLATLNSVKSFLYFTLAFSFVSSYYFRLELFYLSLLLSEISNLIRLNKTYHIDILVYDRSELCTLESLKDFLTSFSDPHMKKEHNLIRQILDFIDKGLANNMGLTPINEEGHNRNKDDTIYTWSKLAFMHSQEALIISEEEKYGLNLIILDTYLASLKSLNEYSHMKLEMMNNK
jgi:hypothetical protein